MNEIYYGDHERRPTDSGFRLLNRFLIAFIIVALCIGGIITSIPIFKQYREQNDRMEQLQKKIAQQKALYIRRSREEQLLKNDPAYIEIKARDQLSVMKPGETIINLDPPRAGSSPAAPAKN